MFRSLVLLLSAALAACADVDPPRLRTLVTVIANQEGRPAEEATTRLVAEGRRALVVIEAALHTASPAGRRRLVRAIGQLGDLDGCALLAHFARYDEETTVREAAQTILRQWSADPSNPRRAAAAARLRQTLPARGAAELPR